YPRTKVIIISIHDDESYVTHALKTGAQGYLLKEMDADSLIEAIKVVHEGGSYLHPKITHNLVREYRRLAKESVQNVVNGTIEYRKPLHLLTKRECEVLQLMSEGRSNSAVTKSLYISEISVKNHVSNILQKMSASDRKQVLIPAIKKGWVEVI